MMENRVKRSPYTRPALPLANSHMSGFFFCGIKLLPVQKVSSAETKEGRRSLLDGEVYGSFRESDLIVAFLAGLTELDPASFL